jgi:hypothetical protein
MAPGAPNMHFIPRGAGGLGIVENIVCGCAECHRVYDNGYHKDINMRDYYGGIIREHLDEHYPGFPDEKRFYNRWEDLK